MLAISEPCQLLCLCNKRNLFSRLTQPFLFKIGVKHLVVFINKADIVDEEMLELVELEMIELLTHFGFDGENTAMIKGSALLALKGDQGQYGEPCIHQLVKAMDRHIPLPQRDFLSPFLMPIDNILSVPGRGTVVIGTVKRGQVKKGDALRILGLGMDAKTNVSAIQAFKKDVVMAMVTSLY